MSRRPVEGRGDVKGNLSFCFQDDAGLMGRKRLEGRGDAKDSTIKGPGKLVSLNDGGEKNACSECSPSLLH